MRLDEAEERFRYLMGYTDSPYPQEDDYEYERREEHPGRQNQNGINNNARNHVLYNNPVLPDI